MGGYGTWDLMARRPGSVRGGRGRSAAGPTRRPRRRSSTFRSGCFTGRKDTAVKPARSRNMVAALEEGRRQAEVHRIPGRRPPFMGQRVQGRGVLSVAVRARQQATGGTGMRYRTFGRLGWRVSEVGYGMWGLAGWTGRDDDETAPVAAARRGSRLQLLRHRPGLRRRAQRSAPRRTGPQQSAARD